MFQNYDMQSDRLVWYVVLNLVHHIGSLTNHKHDFKLPRGKNVFQNFGMQTKIDQYNLIFYLT